MVNLRAAVELISIAASSNGSGSGGVEKRKRGQSADRKTSTPPKPTQALPIGAKGVEAREAAVEISSMKHFGTLKSILENHPDRFPLPSDEG